VVRGREGKVLRILDFDTNCEVSDQHHALNSSTVSWFPLEQRHVAFCRNPRTVFVISQLQQPLARVEIRAVVSCKVQELQSLCSVHSFVLTCALLYVGRGCLGVSLRYLLTSRVKHPTILLRNFCKNIF
jgi:hypothetical protein